MAERHPLARLIDGVKDANNWSDPDLVTNAEKVGAHLSKSNISRYRKPLVSIKGEVIQALAAGLRVTPAQVATAAIESMGIPLLAHDRPTPEQAVLLDTDLSARDKSAILALIAQLRTTDTSANQGETGDGGLSASAAAAIAKLKIDRAHNDGNKGWVTAEDAGHFAGAATSAYCPRFSPDGH